MEEPEDKRDHLSTSLLAEAKATTDDLRRGYISLACETHRQLGCEEPQTAAVIAEMLKCLTLFDQKQRAYSSANIAVFGDPGILVRMVDKVFRLKTLYAALQRGEAPPEADETIEDTLRDLVNYAAMALTCRAGQWEGYEPSS